MTVGRSPEADVFLDDVTVSRDHAVLVHRHGGWYLDDSGSLNGTYVNRKRIDSHRLEDGDELQIGKYKLTYLARLTHGDRAGPDEAAAWPRGAERADRAERPSR